MHRVLLVLVIIFSPVASGNYGAELSNFQLKRAGLILF